MLSLPAAENDGLLDVIINENNPADETPEMTNEAITQRGDLWLLGNHRLLCGDAQNI